MTQTRDHAAMKPASIAEPADAASSAARDGTAPPRAAEREARRASWRGPFDMARGLLVEGLRGRGIATLVLAVQQLVGVTAELATFLVLIAHVQRELGSATPLLSRLLPAPASSSGRLLVTLGVVLALGLTAAWCSYASRRGVLQMVRGFHYRLISSALASLEPGTRERELERVAFVSKSHDVRHLAPVYARYVAGAFRVSLECLHPALVSLAATAVLLYLDPLLTISMAPMALVMWLLLRRLGRQAAAAQGRFFAGSAEVNPELMRLGSEIATDSADETSLRESRPELERSLGRVLDDQYQPTLLLQRASSWTQVALTLGLAWLFLAVGLGLGRAGGSWAGLLSFLVALRFLAGGLRTLSVSAISFARFVPALETYWTLVYERRLDPIAADRARPASRPLASS